MVPPAAHTVSLHRRGPAVAVGVYVVTALEFAVADGYLAVGGVLGADILMPAVPVAGPAQAQLLQPSGITAVALSRGGVGIEDYDSRGEAIEPLVDFPDEPVGAAG